MNRSLPHGIGIGVGMVNRGVVINHQRVNVEGGLGGRGRGKEHKVDLHMVIKIGKKWILGGMEENNQGKVKGRFLQEIQAWVIDS